MESDADFSTAQGLHPAGHLLQRCNTLRPRTPVTCLTESPESRRQA